MSDTKRTELPKMEAWPINSGKIGFALFAASGHVGELTQEEALEALRRINAYRADREAVRALKDALNWAVHLGCGVGKSGGEPEHGEFEACMEAGKQALKLASALGAGESTLKENGE